MSARAAVLAGLQIEVFETDPAVIYALDSDFRITYCNQAWDSFASENGGEQCLRGAVVGRRIAEFIPEPLLRFYMDAFTKVTNIGAIWEHRYDCSDVLVRREFCMRVLPLVMTGGLLVINSKVEERPQPAPASHLPLEAYVRANGVLTMCCHCRRTQRADEPAVWDWVPEHVSHPPRNISHGLCGLCVEYHYGELGDGWK